MYVCVTVKPHHLKAVWDDVYTSALLSQCAISMLLYLLVSLTNLQHNGFSMYTEYAHGIPHYVKSMKCIPISSLDIPT